MGDLKESVNLRGFTVRMISTGLKAEKGQQRKRRQMM